ncbi:MAG: hypothetical protein V5B33_18495 [Candidatus Accumulibacter sp. UW20]
MSGLYEGTTTAGANTKGANTALDVNAAVRVKQLDAREQSLTAREHTLKELERQIKDQATSLKEREAEVEAAESKTQRDLADLAKRQKQVAETESSIEARARDLAQREIEASEGFASKNREALTALTKTHASLRAQSERLQSELDAARIKGIEDLEKRLADERRTRTEALDADIQADRKRHIAKLAAEGATQDVALAEQRARFAKEQQTALEEIERERVRLADLEAELRHRLGDLRWKEEDLAGYRSGIDRSIEERSRDQVASLERQLDALREDHRRDRDLVISLESQLAASRDLLTRFGDDPAEIEKRIAQQAKKISDLEKELLRRPSATDKELLVTLQEQERVWAAERDRLVREITQLKAEQSRWLTGVADLEQQRERREVAERRIEVLAGEMEKYRADVDRMRALYQSPAERAALVGRIEDPWRTDFKRAKGSTPRELDWLNDIVAKCEYSGMRFPKRLVHAFHTSLKAAELSPLTPLTVLAGVSGTGKSELPRLYSRFGGLGFLSLAVQPNWDGPQSLFGFFNSIDNQFNATTVLRAMVQAQHDPDHETYKHGLSDRLLLVLLDEMNLAHVEQYFSDLLSRLEQRRGESRDVTLDIDLGSREPPYQLRLGRNVLWVGTMNEDETTKALSDKVIDRSNLLYFPRPRELHSRTEVTLGAESPLLAESAWREWLQLRSPFTSDELKPFKDGLQEINSRLEYVGRALGHRVWQSVEFYIANHPEVIDARARKDEDALQREMRRAYEDQLVLKVMPKLRGIETSGKSRNETLDPIKKQLAEFGTGLSKDFDIACRVGHGAFLWNSATYLENAE